MPETIETGATVFITLLLREGVGLARDAVVAYKKGKSVTARDAAAVAVERIKDSAGVAQMMTEWTREQAIEIKALRTLLDAQEAQYHKLHEEHVVMMGKHERHAQDCEEVRAELAAVKAELAEVREELKTIKAKV